jgi:hypothetical protein
VFGVFYFGQSYFGQSRGEGIIPNDIVIVVDPSRIWCVDGRRTDWIIEDRADTWIDQRRSTWTVN